MKRVMTFGTFDRFHAGHESYLKQAKALGDYLIVIIARDKTVARIKGRRSDYDEKKRVAAVKSSKLADKVVLGEHGDKYEVIKKYKPDVIALGYDQFTFTFRLEKFLIDHKMNTKVIRMNPYRPTEFKTSLIREKTLIYAAKSI
ncbi:FAD synthase [Candidatus Peregrinibacteria bacterium]|nr:FAD synthase [Candidatus Peregrinibacteria bacterium]